MHKLIFAIFWISGLVSQAQQLQVQTFGNRVDIPVIFLHGGPGYNSVAFEQTTAQELADSGFFVISYDRRGEGRNKSLTANYNFKETIDDISQIILDYELNKVHLIGHSFGGIVATLFAHEHIEKVQSLIIVGAPVSMPETLKHIIASSKSIYQYKKDSTNLKYIDMLENMDASSLPYSSYAFMHATTNGFYTTATPTEAAVKRYHSFRSDTLLQKYASKMEYEAPQGFWRNEGYTSMSIKARLENLVGQNLSVYAIYGLEDGLFSTAQINELAAIIGDDNVQRLENCSHNVFIDRQEKFIQLLQQWTE
jgi:proline iminopeptidase